MEPRTGEGSNPDPCTLLVKPELLTVLQHAGLDLLAYDGSPCSEVAGPLTEAAQRIETDLALAQSAVPPFRKGDIGTNTVEGIRWAAERCADRLAGIPLWVESCSDLRQRKGPNNALSNTAEADAADRQADEDN